MATVTVYVTEPAAPLCVRVCDYLDQHGYRYQRVAVVSDADRQAMIERTGYSSCPIVVIDDQVIGKLEDTIEADRSGRLAELLADQAS
jgi:glutaredoxin